MAPQTLHVLGCANCKVFQVHIVKKTNKWECKICSAKQTVQQVFGTGSGADCRRIVLALNEARGQIEEEAQLDRALANHRQELADSKNSTNETNESKDPEDKEREDLSQAKKSKWSAFVDSDSENHLD